MIEAEFIILTLASLANSISIIMLRKAVRRR